MRARSRPRPPGRPQGARPILPNRPRFVPGHDRSRTCGHDPSHRRVKADHRSRGFPAGSRDRPRFQIPLGTQIKTQIVVASRASAFCVAESGSRHALRDPGSCAPRLRLCRRLRCSGPHVSTLSSEPALFSVARQYWKPVPVLLASGFAGGCGARDLMSPRCRQNRRYSVSRDDTGSRCKSRWGRRAPVNRRSHTRAKRATQNPFRCPKKWLLAMGPR
jgi:hypothetical protein